MVCGNPEISVVVPSRNRANSLRATLEYYERLRRCLDWELIVVDNGSSDGTSRMLEEYFGSSEIVASVVKEPRTGVCKARNSGWRRAKGEIIVFCDDDCYPELGFIEAVRESLEDAELGYVGGRVLLFDPADAPITIQTLGERRKIAAGEFVESGLILGANIAVRRDVLERVGGFDEALGPGTLFPAGEDVDFVNRASSAGFCGAYDPRATVYHHHRRRSKEEVARVIRAYSIGRGAYFMKALLDPIRRRNASRQWYWRTFLGAWRSRAQAKKCFQEMRGALMYCVYRACHKVRLEVQSAKRNFIE